MKIVIDIPEEEYKRVKDGKWYGNDLADYIENGTPLPKGHGKLVDVEDLFSFISDHAYPIRYDCNTIEEGMGMTGISECIRICPTIIEADKE